MKVKIFTEGGGNIGLGHISRCSSLYDEILNRRITVDFIIFGDVFDVDFLNEINISNDNWFNNEYLVNSISLDDLVIVDSYIAEKEIYERISNLSKGALFIDDLGRLNYPRGIVVNPSLDVTNINYTRTSESSVFSGPDYVILRTAFIGARRKTLQKKIGRVLITMGGTDIRKLIPVIIDSICKKRLDLIFDIIIGSEQLETLFIESNNINIHFNINAAEMMELMTRADVAITAAGQTIYELLATETPFIAMQVIENQENNTKSLLKINPKQIVIKHDDNNLVYSLAEAFEIISNFDYRKEHCLAYKGLIDGNGSKRIVDHLLNEM